MKNLLRIAFVFAAFSLFATTATATTRFRDYFNIDADIAQIHPMNSSPSPVWWVNSGGAMNISGGYGHTLQGEQPMGSPLQIRFANHNAAETDNGQHPQNLFRLLTMSKWQNYRQQAYFRINKYHLSDDSHRNGGNGILLFNRYVDSDNLYYAGLRVDGYAVVKKKINGQYYTLASTKVLPGIYNRDTKPNLIPEKRLVGVRADINNTREGYVNIRVYTDMNLTGKWKKVLEVNDKGTGGKPFTTSAYAGIRTDFMDASFENYSIATI